ncbi:CobT, cobaltochelatase, CobT subunit [uncultured Caudovirales phage]|uniref:CobT, cobaltochelatase, CobT subunit n=1 Tax=uncultured Caudovirales phage TaxID=2100421 RepID=A0A6J5QHI7_9CAUD|nr:CobT, cobaltochelatase, CobT subunit [uncultured Caudovirales phage]
MKRLNGIQFRSGVDKAAHKIAADLGMKIKITWESGITTAAINIHGDVMLANVADDAVVTEALVWKYAGFVLHELLHRKWTDFPVIRSAGGDFLRQLHNGVEDAWIENRAVREGLTGNVEQLLSVLVDGMVNQALDNVADWSDTRQYPFSFAVNLRLHGKTVPIAKGHESILTEAQRRLAACTSTIDTLALAKWILSQLQAADQGDKGDDQNGDKGDDQGGDQAGDQDGGADGQDGADSADGGNGSETDSEGPSGDDKGQGKGKGAGQPKKPSTAGPAKPVAGPRSPARPTEPSLESDGDAHDGTYSNESGVAKADRHIRDATTWDISITANARLRYEVKRLFENTANDEWQVNRRAGSLNVRALPKVSTSDRLFKRRLDSEGVDSAVVVVLDVSGSMFDTQYVVDAKGLAMQDANGDYVKTCYMDSAVKATAALLDTLTRAGVKVSLHTFGSRTSVFKGFDEPLARGLSKLAHVWSGGDTNDYQAIRYAHEVLAYRPEARKAVFVITDGEGNAQAAAAQVKSGEALGISTVGIGINHDVDHIYPKSIRINSADDIGNASFKQIKLAA